LKLSNKMNIDIITIFPGMFKSPFSESMLANARKKGIFSLRVHDLRDYTTDKHRTTDDKPYGGGNGMLMKVEPFYKAVKSITGSGKKKTGK